MPIFKNKNFTYLYIYLLILVFFFSEFSTNKAISSNYNISNIEVEEVYDLNFYKSKVIDKAFKEAFKILIFKIVESKDRTILNKISLEEIKSLIENFSIINERFINKKYVSQFEVQFNKKKLLYYLNNRGIVPSSTNEIKTFILPLLIDTKSNELFYLNKNIFYSNWDLNSKNYHLIKYVLPNEDIEDYSIIKKNIENIESYNFNQIINKYNLKNQVILIILKSNKLIRVFSKIKFNEKKMLINNIYNLSEISDEVNINNIILDIKDSYEDKWKSINKINTSIEVPIRLSIDAKNIKLAEKLEEEFASIDLISDFRIDRFNNKEVIYKVIFNNTHDKFLDIMSLYNFKIDTSKETWRLD